MNVLTSREEIWAEGPPRNAWHSFDTTPCLHPWLTRSNLRAVREISAGWREEARRVVENTDCVPNHFAFVGNMANTLYTRAKALARTGAQIELFGLYGDDSPMSDARWEEYDGVLPQGISYLRDTKTFLDGVQTGVPFCRFDVTGKWATMSERDVPPYARIADFRRWPEYFANIPALERLQPFDAVLATQHPFIGYLSGKPYVATQTGGDIWLEASRDDALGRLQRTAFAKAGCVLISNPWTCAHARRYGLQNLIYLPLIVDERDYAPGPPELRQQWETACGGDFFVLSTARADNYYKGLQLGLRGFAEFARKFPGARLVCTAWGKDVEAVKKTAAQLGMADRVMFLPVAGKRMLVKYLRSADCLLDQFILGYYGATAIEAAACGIPVIMRFEYEQYDALFEGGAPPFLNSASSSQIANALEFLATDIAHRRELSDKHRDWFLRNHSGKRWAAEYFALLAALASGHKFNFAASPLATELSTTERLYHAEQLAAAPLFPDYEKPTSEPEVSIREAIDEQSRLIRSLTLEVQSIGARVTWIERVVRRITRPIFQLRQIASFILGRLRKARNRING